MRRGGLSLVLAPLCLFLAVSAAALPDGVERVMTLPPSDNNPRNSEGDFIALQDGRIAFVYTHFVGGADDHSAAHLAARFSEDGGRTWSPQDTRVLPNEGRMNVMSVSLLRLQDGRIALLYLRKNADDDCMPFLRFSSDEMLTWSEPVACISTPAGYYVVNNDRLVQLSDGRLVVPASRHSLKGDKFKARGQALCALSDDNGATWHLSSGLLEAPEDVSSGLQEPGVVELRDGRLWMFCRTSAGRQFSAFSSDRGETWSTPEPSDILSPTSPASIERIPGREELVMVWNDHRNVPPALEQKRTPLSIAISRDEGKTWENSQHLEDNPHGWYCYTAIFFTGEHLMLGHCAGDRRENNGLAMSQVLRMPVSLLIP